MPARLFDPASVRFGVVVHEDFVPGPLIYLVYQKNSPKGKTK
jgi:hypothetical protein